MYMECEWRIILHTHKVNRVTAVFEVIILLKVFHVSAKMNTVSQSHGKNAQETETKCVNSRTENSLEVVAKPFMPKHTNRYTIN